MKLPRMLLAILLAFVASGFATDANATECKPMHADIVSSFTAAGCTSPVGICTAGNIDGNQGLNGSTFFTADSIGPGPATAPNPAVTISYSGILQITTEHGTLTTRDTGILDNSTGTPTSGLFSSFDLVTRGTGKYQGATGSFFIGGKLLPSGEFVTTVITGAVCIP